MLTEAQQERYARHLLLDEFGGEGQERLLEAAVHVHGTGPAALWAARYLAVSGIGQLEVDEPAWREELRGLGPWLHPVVPGVHWVHLTPSEGPTPAESAMNGAQAALEAIRRIFR
jgi:hypothetical protein